MNLLTSISVDSVAQPWWNWMVAISWQLSVIVAVVVTVDLVFARRSSRMRYQFWLLVPLRLALPPSLALMTGWAWWMLPTAPTTEHPQVPLDNSAIEFIPAANTAIPAVAPAPESLVPLETQPRVAVEVLAESTTSTPAIWLPWVFTAWLIVATALAIRILAGAIAATRLVRSAKDVTDERRTLLDACQQRVGLGRPVRLRESDRVQMPMVVGIVQPAVVLPTDMTLQRGELEAVLIHELHHVRRWDTLVKLAQSCLTCVYFFHPLVWFSNYRIGRLREEACDEATVGSLGGKRCNYGAGIVKIAERFTQSPPAYALAIAESRNQVKDRLKRILDPHLPFGRRAPWWTSLTILVVALVILPSGSQSAPTDGEEVTIRGVVLAPSGTPVPDATVLVTRMRKDWSMASRPAQVMKRTTSAADGSFQLHVTIPDKESEEKQGPIRWYRPQVIATCQGFGPDWYDLADVDRGNARFQLAADESPIQAQLVDLEGRPVPGVQIAVRGIRTIEGDGVGIESWLTEVQQLQTEGESAIGKLRDVVRGRRSGELPSGDSLWDNFDAFPAITTTDANGRFQFRGIGENRLAQLRILGPGAAYQEVEVMTHVMKPVRKPNPDDGPFRSNTIYGATNSIVVSPACPIIGVVRDLDTKQPIQGAVVTASHWAGARSTIRNLFQTQTDRDGKYRLDMMPAANGHRLQVIPGADSPYFITERIEVPEGRNGNPVTVDVDLKRGVMIEGTLTDRTSGEPVAAAIHYYPLLSNPTAGLYKNFDQNARSANWTENHYRSNADGRFRIVAIPGDGILVAKCYDAEYTIGVGADAIAGLDQNQNFPTYNRVSARRFHTYRAVTIPSDAERVTFDLEVDRGQGISINFVDDANVPVEGVRVAGKTARSNRYGEPFNSGELVVSGLAPGNERILTFHCPTKNLAQTVTSNELMTPPNASVVSKLGDKRIVRLEPCGRISGRLLRSDQPAAGVDVGIVAIRGDGGRGRALQIAKLTTDTDGKFDCDTLPPNGRYVIVALTSRREVLLNQGIDITAGEHVTLGEMDLSNAN